MIDFTGLSLSLHPTATKPCQVPCKRQFAATQAIRRSNHKLETYIMIPKSLSFSLLSKTSFVTLAATAALAAQVSAGQIKVLGQNVQGVPDANPVAVSDSIISPGFSLRPSTAGTGSPRESVRLDRPFRLSRRRSDRAQSRMKTPISSSIITRADRPMVTTTDAISFSKVTRTAATWPTSLGSTSMSQILTIG